MTIYRIKRTGRWVKIREFQSAFEMWGDISDDIEHYVDKLIRNNLIEPMSIDECSVWELCKYGMKTDAILAFRNNMKKNNVLTSLRLANDEVTKIMNIVNGENSENN